MIDRLSSLVHLHGIQKWLPKLYIAWFSSYCQRMCLIEKLPNYGVLTPPHLTTSLTSHITHHISSHLHRTSLVHITHRISSHSPHLTPHLTHHISPAFGDVGVWLFVWQHLVMLECHFPGRRSMWWNFEWSPERGMLDFAIQNASPKRKK